MVELVLNNKLNLKMLIWAGQLERPGDVFVSARGDNLVADSIWGVRQSRSSHGMQADRMMTNYHSVMATANGLLDDSDQLES